MSNTASQAKKKAPDEGAEKHEQVDCISGGSESSSQNNIVELADWMRPDHPQFRYEEAEWNLRAAEPAEQQAREEYHKLPSANMQGKWDDACRNTKKWRDQLKQAEAELKAIAQAIAEAQAAEEHAQWLAALTPADVPEVATDDLFSLDPSLLAHVTVAQAERISADRRKDFSPEQAEALAGRFAEVDELRRQKELARLEAKQRAQEAQEEAEREALLEELGIVPFTDDDDDDEEDQDATPMLLDGHLPANCLTLLYGPTKHGKTTVAAGLARTLATGQPVFPSVQPTCGPMSGIVVTSEDSAAQFKVILRAYRDHDGEVAEGTIYPWHSKAPLMVQSDGEWIASEALDQLELLIIRTRARFVFLDHLGTLAKNMNLISDNDMRPLLDKLSEIAEEYEVAVILIHHGATDAPFGSVYLQNLPRNLLQVKRCRGAVELTQPGINHREPMPTVKLERVGAILREVTAQDAEEPTVEAQDQDQDQQPAVDPGELLVDWLAQFPEALITPDALRVGGGADAKAVLEFLRDQIPGLKNSEAKAAALACVEAGTLALVERKIERKPKMVLAVQPE